jgi:L-2-hydroxyglutarate oxidase LhgO
VAALAGYDVIVAEKTSGIGNGVSSRNSEVIHGGMYYPTGSLRAWHCPRGRRLMYKFCASHGVPHRKCGKLIVATEDAEVAKMEAILKQGETNGVEGFRMIDGAARAMEPQVSCGSAAFAGDRHRRQSFIHARVAGRSGRSRRRHRF